MAQKLQLKSGQRLVLLNTPPDYAAQLDAVLPDAVATDTAAGATDAALLFVNQRADVERMMPEAVAAVKPGGLLWIAYPKGGAKAGTDLNRDRLWQAVQPSGWRPVRQIALDEAWSAMRFKAPGEA